MKKALILGIQGQDGSLLAKYLLHQGYQVFGGAREINNFKNWRLISLGILDEVFISQYEINNLESLKSLMESSAPNEIYLLAGDSKTYSSFSGPLQSSCEQIIAVCNLYDLALKLMPNVRIFAAGSSEMFGALESAAKYTTPILADENSACFPTNPYGVGKLSAFHLGRIYRKYHGLYICTGILFNHESYLRDKQFVTRKISFNLARLRAQGGDPITLGNIDSGRDWTSAADVVKAMHATLQSTSGRDYVISSGRASTVREFFIAAAKACGFSPRFYGDGLEEYCYCENRNLILMKVDPKNFRVIDTPLLIGQSKSIHELMEVKLTSDISKIAHEMVEADIHRWDLMDLTH